MRRGVRVPARAAAAACRPVAGTVTRCVFVTHGAPAPSTPLARTPPRNDACTNLEFHFNGSPAGSPWSARGYTYAVVSASGGMRAGGVHTATLSWRGPAGRRSVTTRLYVHRRFPGGRG
jgi:hypothetical protein